jgi:hypothetical protein
MTTIIFQAVAGRMPALLAGGAALVLFSAFWLVLPFSMRRGENPRPPNGGGHT